MSFKGSYFGTFKLQSGFVACTSWCIDSIVNYNIIAFTLLLQEAPFLAKQGLDVTDAVLDALSKNGYDDQKVKRVMIQSSNSAVLIKIKEKRNFEFVYEVDEVIRDALNSTMLDIKKFADSVVISKRSVYSRDSIGFLTGVTHVVPKLKAFELPVYVKLFQNEFFPQAWDFFSDAHVELNSFVVGADIDGVITDFPKTANSYRSKFPLCSYMVIILTTYIIQFFFFCIIKFKRNYS